MGGTIGTMNDLANDLSYLVNAALGKKEQYTLRTDIDVLIRLAYTNQMQGILFTALVQEDIPEEKKEQLRSGLRQSLYRTMRQVFAGKEMERRFEEAGIVNQPMKGICMKQMYPSPNLRDMGDIDILVDQNSAAECRAVMESLGYTLVQDVKHHFVYRNEEGIVVEIHNALYDKTTDRTQYEYFLDLKNRNLKENCAYTYQFSVDDFYIYMIAHMARHFYKMGCGVRNLIDIKVYLDLYGSRMDMEYIREVLRKLGLYDFHEHMSTLAFIWLDHKESSELYDDLFDYMVFSGIYGKDENGIWNKYAFQKSGNTKDYSAKLKRWYLFPPYDYMVEYYPFLKKHPYVLPFMWVKRGFNGVFRHKGEKKVEMLKTIDDDSIMRITRIYQNMNLKFQK